MHVLFMIQQLSSPVRSSMDVDELVSAGLQLSLACRSGREVQQVGFAVLRTVLHTYSKLL